MLAIGPLNLTIHADQLADEVDIRDLQCRCFTQAQTAERTQAGLRSRLVNPPRGQLRDLKNFATAAEALFSAVTRFAQNAPSGQADVIRLAMSKLIKIGVGVAVAAAVGLSTAPAHADVFDMCPDGHEGVVGGHTTCDFAENVREAFFASGMSHHFPAYSPVTGETYAMDCDGEYPAYFSDGVVVTSTRCYTVASDAEVVVW